MTYELASLDFDQARQVVIDSNRSMAQNAQQLILTRQEYEPATGPNMVRDTEMNIYRSTAYLGRLTRFTRIFTINIGYMATDVLKTDDIIMDDIVVAAVEKTRNHIYDGLQVQPTSIDQRPEALSSLLAKYNVRLVKYPFKLQGVYEKLKAGDIKPDNATETMNELERHVGRVLVLPVVASSVQLFEAVLHSNYVPAATLPTLQYYLTNIKNAELTS